MAVAILDDPDRLVDEFSIGVSRFSLIKPGSFARTA